MRNFFLRLLLAILLLFLAFSPELTIFANTLWENSSGDIPDTELQLRKPLLVSLLGFGLDGCVSAVPDEFIFIDTDREKLEISLNSNEFTQQEYWFEDGQFHFQPSVYGMASGSIAFTVSDSLKTKSVYIAVFVVDLFDAALRILLLIVALLILKQVRLLFRVNLAPIHAYIGVRCICTGDQGEHLINLQYVHRHFTTLKQLGISNHCGRLSGILIHDKATGKYIPMLSFYSRDGICNTAGTPVKRFLFDNDSCKTLYYNDGSGITVTYFHTEDRNKHER